MRLIDQPTTHTLSTAAAARLLNYTASHALQTMKQHHLEHMRWGKSMRWVAREVELLAEALRRDTRRAPEEKLWV